MQYLFYRLNIGIAAFSAFFAPIRSLTCPRTSSVSTSSFILLLLLVAVWSPVSAQNGEFDPALYEEFIEKNKSLTSEELMALYPAGKFYPAARTRLTATEYLDSILIRYPISDYERSLLSRNGFVVLPSSVSDPTFGTRFEEIFHYDLPVYVSSDAILHSMHMSYNALFEDIEEQAMHPMLTEMLSRLHTHIADYHNRYNDHPVLAQAVRDLDVYLSVPLRLLGTNTAPLYPDNTSRIDSILGLIAAEGMAEFSLFDIRGQWCDFSQFTPRGRYTQSEEMRQYFQAMMWLGRMEFYLLPPQNTEPEILMHDAHRPAVAATMLAQAMKESGAEKLAGLMDAILRQIIGASDNITPERLASTLEKAGIADIHAMADSAVFSKFQDVLIADPAAFQAINSQILARGFTKDSVIPAASFMLLGQRFIIDSYISQNVVYDRIPQVRQLPSAFDILFALGNNAAAQFLKPDLDTHKYAPYLAGLRYLIDSYDDEFWGSSLYNAWLQSIRTLNTPDTTTRKHLPSFMQTAAWWQLKMNSQLAAWAQLRHDNLLYAKQSYTTAIATCSFPYSYVEPEPDFFRAVTAYADSARSVFSSIGSMLRTEAPIVWRWDAAHTFQTIEGYFTDLSSVAHTLGAIAEKELGHVPLSEGETVFLRSMLYRSIDDYTRGQLTGWYVDLFYAGSDDMLRSDYVVADVHTAPGVIDSELPAGWVYHVGTGPVNLAIVIADCGEGYRAYIGPVFSYYERVTENFKRLTDEEWEKTLEDSAQQLPIAYAYMVSPDGRQPDTQPMLDMYTTSVPEPGADNLPVITPNPTSGDFIVEFPLQTPSTVEVALYSARGERIAVLDKSTTDKRYSRTFRADQLAAGMYFVVIDVGDMRRMEVLIKQ